MYSLIGSCRPLGIEHFAYLRDVLARASDYPAKRIADPTPAGYLAEIPAALAAA